MSLTLRSSSTFSIYIYIYIVSIILVLRARQETSEGHTMQSFIGVFGISIGKNNFSLRSISILSKPISIYGYGVVYIYIDKLGEAGYAIGRRQSGHIDDGIIMRRSCCSAAASSSYTYPK